MGGVVLPPGYSHNERMARKTHLERRPEREGKSGRRETSPPALFLSFILAYSKLHHTRITLSFLIFFIKRAVLENSAMGNALELQSHDVGSSPAFAMDTACGI